LVNSSTSPERIESVDGRITSLSMIVMVCATAPVPVESLAAAGPAASAINRAVSEARLDNMVS
jgi:hypothetical protein